MIRRRTLPNGVRIASEKLESVYSCGVGIWVEIGSRHEHPEEGGLTHFIEHMLFKGTSRNNVRQLADAINYLGGNVNAFTSQEVLCLHAKTVAGKAAAALDLLAEMLLDSVFPPQEVSNERRVVLEEWRMYTDTPDDLVVDLFMRNLWPADALGRPVIGSVANIRGYTREAILEYWRREFHPARVLVAISGAFDAQAVNAVIRRRFAPLATPTITAPPPPGFVANGSLPRQTYVHRTIEQTHFCLGVSGPDRRSADRYPFGLLNMILGGGMTSRLFQEIREKRGLAYSIGSFTSCFRDRGVFAVSGGTGPANFSEVLRLTLEELNRLCVENVPQNELDLVREQVVDSIMLGMENTETRMIQLADSILTWGQPVPIEEKIARYRGVEPVEIRRTACQYLRDGKWALSSLGPRRQQRPWNGRVGMQAGRGAAG